MYNQFNQQLNIMILNILKKMIAFKYKKIAISYKKVNKILDLAPKYMIKAYQI